MSESDTVAQPRYFSLGWSSLGRAAKLFDFIVEELSRRETLLAHRIRPLRIALKNQRDDLLGFRSSLEMKLVEIAQRFDTPLYLVQAVCLLQRKSPLLVPTGSAGIICTICTRKVSPFNGSRKPGDATNPKSQFSGRESQFKAAQLLFLRRQLGPQYLDLLQFFLNHRTFMRSECPERGGQESHN